MNKKGSKIAIWGICIILVIAIANLLTSNKSNKNNTVEENTIKNATWNITYNSSITNTTSSKNEIDVSNTTSTKNEIGVNNTTSTENNINQSTTKTSTNSKNVNSPSSSIGTTSQKQSTSSAKSSSSTATTNKKVNTSTVSASNDNSRTVYVTPTGKRYHYISTCGGKNSTASTLNKAKARGLTPCQKCAR